MLSETELLKRVDALEAFDTQGYQDLTKIHMEPDDLAEIRSLDPFGAAYRERVQALYARLSGRPDYQAEEHEKSQMGPVPDIWREASPWNFGSTAFVGEFLTAWGAIFETLEMTGGQSVLEYGPGSGQALLMLARCGMKTSGVDIDAESLSLLRRQAEAMGLDMALEQGGFGEGFDGQTFDRILFFEAFHHALAFDRLLLKLHRRLAKGGRIVFAGEPVVGEAEAAVPYPWGPRTDALSVFCIRKRGWMELGFQQAFFVRLFMRSGWKVRFRQGPTLRSSIYVAERLGAEFNPGEDWLLPDGWSVPENEFRWTIVDSASVPLPDLLYPSMNVSVAVANHLPWPKRVTLRAGEVTQTVDVASGQSHVFELGRLEGVEELRIEADTANRKPRGVAAMVRPRHTFADERPLGIAVKRIWIEPA